MHGRLIMGTFRSDLQSMDVEKSAGMKNGSVVNMYVIPIFCFSSSSAGWRMNGPAEELANSVN
jgi:hypothetical protein